MMIGALTTTRNEGPFLLEWLAWHRIIGVTDFLVFSNDCDDSSDTMLDRLADAGVLTHIRNTNPPRGKSIQWAALKAGWGHDIRKRADWLLISDIDEFPVIHAGNHRIEDLLSAIPDDTDAIALPWRLFGTSGQESLLNKFVTQSLTKSAPSQLCHPIAATFFKSLFRPSAFKAPGVHRPKRPVSDAPNWIAGNGKPMAQHLSARDGRLSLIGYHEARSLVEMHHYSLRSAQDFIVKADRGLPNRKGKDIDLAYWVERNFNSEDNSSALALGPQLKAEVNDLLALPGVAEHFKTSITWHRDRFQKLVRDPHYYRLYCSVLHASDSLPLSTNSSLRLLRMFSELERNDQADDQADA